MRRAVEHRALMAIAIGDLGVANTSTMAVAPLDRGWTLYAHTPPRGSPLDECAGRDAVARVWESLGVLHDHQISHGDLRSQEITVDDGTALFGGFGSAEYGATDVQLQADIAQLLVTTSAICTAPSRRCGAAIDVVRQGRGPDGVAHDSRNRLCRNVSGKSVADAKTVMSAARDEVKRQTGADQIKAETITRFTRNQIIQLVLLVALVYVAYPFISTVPPSSPNCARRTGGGRCSGWRCRR